MSLSIHSFCASQQETLPTLPATCDLNISVVCTKRFVGALIYCPVYHGASFCHFDYTGPSSRRVIYSKKCFSAVFVVTFFSFMSKGVNLREEN